MAKKKQDEAFDLDFDFDEDLNFDTLDSDVRVNDIRARSDVNPKKRSAVTSAFKGAISGAKSTVLSENTLRTFAQEALPKEYQVIGSRVEEVSGHISSLYREAAREIKPTAKRFTKVLEKMSSDENSRSRRLASKIKDALGIYDAPSGPSKQQQEEQTIAGSLAEVFNTQIDLQARQQARDDTKGDLDRQVEAKRFTSQQGLLTSIDHNLAALSNYETQVTQAYQKKSLELQYRSYFVNAELLTKSKEYFEIFKTQNDAVVKNTGLPEFTKIQNTERFKDIARNKLFNNIQGKLFNSESVIGKGFEKIKKRMVDQIREMSSSIQMGLDMSLDAIDQLSMQQQDLGDGLDMGDMSGANTAGNIGASLLLQNPVNKAAAKLGARLRRTIAPENGRLDKFGKKWVGAAMNPQGLAQDAYHSDYFNDADGNSAKSFIRSLLEPFAKQDVDMKLVGAGGMSNLTQPDAIFDNRVYRSITDIIPGYLGKILQENTRSTKLLRMWVEHDPAFASGLAAVDGVEVQRFDFESGRFNTESAIKESITKKLINPESNGKLHDELARFVKTFKLDRILTEPQIAALKKALLRWMMDGNTLTFKTLTNQKFLRYIDQAHRSRVSSRLEDIASRASEMMDGDGDTTYKSAVDKFGRDIQNTIPAQQGIAQQYTDAGMGDLLGDMGITKTKNNVTELDKTSYVERLLDARGKNPEPPDPGTVTSDIHAKRDIKPYHATSDIHAKQNISPAPNVLDRLAAVKNYQWQYKAGRGDGGAHVGPMAQEVQSRFGNGAAPGGTSIDLVTMNGLTMQAVQDLNTKVDTRIATNKTGDAMLDVLGEIRTHTASIDSHIAGMDGKLFNGITFKAGDKLQSLGVFARLAGGRFKRGWSDIKDGWNNADSQPSPAILQEVPTSATLGIGDRATRLLSGIKKRGIGAFNKLQDNTTSAYTFTKDRIAKPTFDLASEQIKKNKGRVTDGLGKLISGAWNLAGDIYTTTSDVVRNKIPQALQDMWTNVKKAGTTVAELFDEPTDIYVRGENEPRLTAQLMRLGGYIDTVSGKAITRPGLITGAVATTDGHIVLTTEDITRGLINSQGVEIEAIRTKAMRFIKERAQSAYARVAKFGSMVMGKTQAFGQAAASKVSDGISSVGGYNRYIYNVLLDIRDISIKNLLGRPGKMRLRSFKDEKGINKSTTAASADKLFGRVKQTGTVLRDRVKDLTTANKHHADNVIGTIASGVTGLRSKLKTPVTTDTPDQPVPTIRTRFDTAATTVKDRIRDLTHFNDVDGSGRRDGSWLEKLDKMKNAAAERRRKSAEEHAKDKPEPWYRGDNVIDTMVSGISGLWSKLKPPKVKDETDTPSVTERIKEQKDQLVNKARTSYDTVTKAVKDRVGGLTHFNDVDGSGRRDGSWLEKLDKMKNASEERRHKSAEEHAKNKSEARYRGGNVIDMMIDKIASMKDMFGGVMDTLSGSIGDMLGGAGDAVGRRRGRRGLGRGAARRPGILRRGVGAVARGVGTVANYALNPVKGLQMAGKGALFAGRGIASAASAVTTVGRLGLGAVGIGQFGAMGAGMLASPLVPFIAGAAAVGAVGYGLYKGYQFFTRNSASKLTAIRLAQYGIPPADSEYYHYLLKLEQYVSDNATVIRQGQAMIDQSKIDGNVILEIFGLDPEADEEHIAALQEWFLGRFVHVYNLHRTALFKANSKLAIADIDKLKLAEAKIYIDAIKVDIPYYNVTNSPIKDYLQFLAGKSDVEAAIVAAKKDLGLDKLDKAAKEPKTLADMNKAAIISGAAAAVSKSDPTSKNDEGGKPSVEKSGLPSTIQSAVASSVLGRAADLFKSMGITALKANPVYALYRYFKDRNVSRLDYIRLAQYGLPSYGDENDRYQQIFKLEDYIQKKVEVFKNDGFTVSDNRIEMQVVYEIFDVDPETPTGLAKAQTLAVWLSKRFIPTYVKNRNALWATNPRLTLMSISNLKSENFEKYVSLLDVPDDIYQTKESPFAGVDLLSASRADYLDAVTRARATLPPARYQKRPTTIATAASKPVGEITSVAPSKEPDSLVAGSAQPSVQSSADKILGTSKTPLAQASQPAILNNEAFQKNTSVISPELCSGESGGNYIKLGSGVELQGINPTMLQRFKAMAQEYGEMSGKKIQVNSGYRSYEKQAALHAANPSKAAPPGRSLHESGLAVDINSTDAAALDQLGLMKKYGFTRPVGGEPWHVEPAGIQGKLTAVRQNPQLASELVLASAHRGGGGYGAQPGAVKYRRNDAVAQQILASGSTSKPTPSSTQIALSSEGVTPEGSKGKVAPPAKTEQVSYTTKGFDPDAFGKPASSPALAAGGKYPSAANDAKPAMSTPTSSIGAAAAGMARDIGNGGLNSSRGAARTAGNTARTMGVDDRIVSIGEATVSSSANIRGQYGINDVAGKAGFGAQPGTMDAIRDLSTGNYKSPDAIKRMVQQVAQIAGVDPTTLQTFAAIESGFKATARSSQSSAGGLFQFVDKTWQYMLGKHGRQYGLGPNTSKNDPVANALMAAEYMKANARLISDVAPNASAVELYAAHMLGPSGAKKLLSASPDTIAAELLPKAARSNTPIFYNNNQPRTIEELLAHLDGKVTSKANEFNIGAPAANDSGLPPISASSDAVAVANPVKDTSTTGASSPLAAIGTAMANSSQPAAVTAAQPSFNVPTAPRTASNVTPIDNGSRYNATDMLKQLSGVETLMGKSVSLQEQMLQVLTTISGNISAEKFAEIVTALKSAMPSETAPASQAPASRLKTSQMDKLPISLNRKVI